MKNLKVGNVVLWVNKCSGYYESDYIVGIRNDMYVIFHARCKYGKI